MRPRRPSVAWGSPPTWPDPLSQRGISLGRGSPGQTKKERSWVAALGSEVKNSGQVKMQEASKIQGTRRARSKGACRVEVRTVDRASSPSLVSVSHVSSHVIIVIICFYHAMFKLFSLSSLPRQRVQLFFVSLTRAEVPGPPLSWVLSLSTLAHDRPR